MYGYGYDQYCDPCAGSGYGSGGGKGFALIVVLFILLIIVGASQFGDKKGAASPAASSDCKCQ
ncbi:YjcZ family sporulation protein [Shouchella lonarensis]|uniref:YjcZ family sporulation protein n=1 Tax=Shouchella lonarensis TaxID=1464122 RepID=UPI000B806371|nr:YjcZ family sporulation protein [Shouchella lonarensis]